MSLARQRYDAATEFIDSCTSFKVDGHRLSVGTLSAPQAGDASHAVRFNGTIDNVGIAFDVTYALSGQYVVLIEHGEPHQSTPDFTSAMLSKAVDKVGSATAPGAST